jgi:sulfatase-modifying factor enzyme 1
MPPALPRFAFVSALCAVGFVDVHATDGPVVDHPDRETLAHQREALFETMTSELLLSPQQMTAVREIFAGSPVLGQGNPAISVHPMSREQCRTIRAAAPMAPSNPARCGAANMVPLYDPEAGETDAAARTCIDQYEFPDIPCEYPVVHVTAREAVLLCEAIGKRICDAHEWEGACAGAVHEPEGEYAWGRSRGEMRELHNEHREVVWAYGSTMDQSKCATGSFKSPTCPGAGYLLCGSNTYPAGAFPACVSPFGVYDLHGNAAEHMNLPLRPEELSSRGGHGWTEMKGSWFIFATIEAHPDDCRWRAPDWHGSRVTDVASHSNYHLGFRCCKTLTK